MFLLLHYRYLSVIKTKYNNLLQSDKTENHTKNDYLKKEKVLENWADSIFYVKLKILYLTSLKCKSPTKIYNPKLVLLSFF